VKPAPFEYVRPGDLHSALEVLATNGSEAAVLAGGQSLVPILNLRLANPSIVVDINRIPDLDRIDVVDGQLELGCRVRHNDVLRSPQVNEASPLLTRALSHVAHEAVRNRGTLGGSLALADPAAELPACAVCLGANMVLASARGERIVAADAFFEGLYSTALAPDELLTRIAVPVLGSDWRFEFEEIARRHGDFAISGIAFAARLDGLHIAECRIVFAGIEAAPRRARGLESCLVGSELPARQALAEAKATCATELEPMEGGAYPPEYRLHLASVLLGRVLGRLADGITRGTA
jgi:carbon-monoxide dehydrogenase medium subunit